MPICLAVVRSAMICHCWELRTVRRLHMASCATEFRLVLTWVFSPYDFLSLCQRFEETYCLLLQGWRPRRPTSIFSPPLQFKSHEVIDHISTKVSYCERHTTWFSADSKREFSKCEIYIMTGTCRLLCRPKTDVSVSGSQRNRLSRSGSIKVVTSALNRKISVIFSLKEHRSFLC